MRIDGLTLGQLEEIGAEVWGPATEIHVRSERLVYVVRVLGGADVEGVTPNDVRRIREAGRAGKAKRDERVTVSDEQGS